jgi:hypothetical protein
MKILLSGKPRGWRALLVAGALGATVSAACGSDDEPTPVPGGNNAGIPPGVGELPEMPGGGGGTAGSDAQSPDPGGVAGSIAVDAGRPADSSTCVPGETRECVFERLCTGVQECGPDGIPGPCECGTSALVGTGIVGARCTGDDDCGGGTCFRADSDSYRGAGGPAGGYCTFSCTRDAGGDDCATHDPQSFCAPIGPSGALFCLRTCLSLDPEPGEAKCLNRSDLVCLSPAAGGGAPFDGTRQQGYCEPLCGSDADCPAGRSCHAQGKVCTLGQFPGKPIGASCSLESDCSGYECEGRNAQGVGVCTAPCVLGALSGCGFARDDAERGAACLTPVVAAGRFSEGPGDRGFCGELCDAAEDCEQAAAGWICAPLTAEAAKFFGRGGGCIPPQ